MQIEWSNYPPVPWKSYLAQVRSPLFLWIFLWLLMFCFDSMYGSWSFSISHLSLSITKWQRSVLPSESFQFIGFAKIALIAVVISGSNPFMSVGLGYPGVLQWAQGNKVSRSCITRSTLDSLAEPKWVPLPCRSPLVWCSSCSPTWSRDRWCQRAPLRSSSTNISSGVNWRADACQLPENWCRLVYMIYWLPLQPNSRDLAEFYYAKCSSLC